MEVTTKTHPQATRNMNLAVPVETSEQLDDIKKHFKHQNKAESFIYAVNETYKRLFYSEKQVEIVVRIPGHGENSAIVTDGDVLTFQASSSAKATLIRQNKSRVDVI